jgi:hypothetical protein
MERKHQKVQEQSKRESRPQNEQNEQEFNSKSPTTIDVQLPSKTKQTLTMSGISPSEFMYEYLMWYSPP